MAKKIKVVIAQGVKIDGKYPPLGAEIDIDEKEARRLLELGAVSLPRPKIEAAEDKPSPAASAGGKGNPNKKPTAAELAAAEADAALIAQIEAAETLEALQALLTAEKPSDAVAAAAEKRWAELEAAAQQ